MLFIFHVKAVYSTMIQVDVPRLMSKVLDTTSAAVFGRTLRHGVTANLSVVAIVVIRLRGCSTMMAIWAWSECQLFKMKIREPGLNQYRAMSLGGTEFKRTLVTTAFHVPQVEHSVQFLGVCWEIANFAPDILRR